LRRASAARRSSGSASGRVGFIAGNGGWMCPVQGPRSFTNDWGQPRSGGRRHQGTDILSPRGTPVVAVVGGSVRGHNSRLGGISFYLNGNDGNTYFGTHLQSLSGASGRVRQGTVLGYVGNTGNARGGPTHLHFEIHPGGGRPVNPYPTLRAHC
jgi:murein DD-endopeptidase MepM/ murein hydrolase activator NlpD